MNAVVQLIRKYQKYGDLRSELDLSPSTLYVVRIMITDSGIPHKPYKFGISKPCIHCSRILHKFNVNKIYYTDIIDGEEVLCELRKNPDADNSIIPKVIIKTKNYKNSDEQKNEQSDENKENITPVKQPSIEYVKNRYRSIGLRIRVNSE